MQFAFTDEQQMICDTASAFLTTHSTSEAVRTAMLSDAGYTPEMWQRITGGMVWQALHIPESCEGMGLGYVELAALFEQCGRHLLCAPFFSTVALGINTFLLCASDDQRAEHLPALAAGSTATLALGVADCRSPADLPGKVVSTADGVVINGEYRFVVDGHSAETLLLVAVDEQGEVGVFVTPGDAAGISRANVPTLDQTRRLSTVTVTDLELPASARLNQSSWTQLQKVLDLARIALAAEQAGIAQAVLDDAVAYSQERQQFNRPIASFQAIKHKAADMMLRSEVARSAVYYAACIADEALSGGELAGELAEAASIAKAWCNEAAFENAGEALQIHGGVGFTWEYDIHLYFKRAKASQSLLGSSDRHREQIAALLLDDSCSANDSSASTSEEGAQ